MTGKRGREVSPAISIAEAAKLRQRRQAKKVYAESLLSASPSRDRDPETDEAPPPPKKRGRPPKVKDKPKDPVEQDSAEPKTTSKRASRKAPQPKPKTVRKAVEPERPTRKAAEAVTHPADKRIHTPPSTALTSARSPSRDPIDSMSGSAVDVAEVLPFGAAVGVPPDLDAASPESPSPNCVSPPSPDFITAIEGEKASPKVSKLHPRPQEAESDDSDGEEVDSRGRTGLWAKEVINEAPPEPLSPAAVAIQAEAKPARSSPQTPCLAMQPFTDQRQQVAPHQTPNAPSITAETIDLPRVHPTYESNSHDDNISMKTLRILHANGMNISPLFGIPALNSQWGPPPPSINVHSVAHEKYHVQHDFNEHLFTPSQPKRLPDMGRPPLPRRSLPAPPSMSTVPHTPSIASGTDRSLMRDVMNGHSKPSLSKSSPPDNSSLPPKLPTVLNLRDLLRGSNVPPDLADSLAESLEAQLGLAESKYRTQQNLRDQDLEREVEAARGRWMNDKRVAEAEYASLLDAHNFRVRTQAHSLIKLASRDSQVRKLVDMEDQDELEKLVQYLNNEVCWTGPGRVRDMRTLMVDPNILSRNYLLVKYKDFLDGENPHLQRLGMTEHQVAEYEEQQLDIAAGHRSQSQEPESEPPAVVSKKGKRRK